MNRIQGLQNSNILYLNFFLQIYYLEDKKKMIIQSEIFLPLFQSKCLLEGQLVQRFIKGSLKVCGEIFSNFFGGFGVGRGFEGCFVVGIEILDFFHYIFLRWGSFLGLFLCRFHWGFVGWGLFHKIVHLNYIEEGCFGSFHCQGVHSINFVLFRFLKIKKSYNVYRVYSFVAA